jgi:molybdate transport system substrate-binding protein
VRDRVAVIELPRSDQPPVRYEICVVRRSGANTSAAQQFIERVRSSAGQATLKRFGFGPLPRG